MSAQDGIVTIDTGYVRPAFCAAYLVIENGRAAFIDTGTGKSVPRLLAALRGQGLEPGAVDWVIATHVHLDHAGGAGPLMRELPNATFAVHPQGARHMLDPARLEASAREVYGAEYDRHHGPMTPIVQERLRRVDDGQVLELAGRPLRCVHTPGHARHHLSVWDARSRSWFCGDTFGISYRELDSARGAFAVPSTSPVQFDPDALRDSVRRILAEAPEAVHVTHYGRVTGVQQLGASLIAQIDAMVDLARRFDGQPDRHARLVQGLARLYVERAQRQGIDDATRRVPELLEMDIELNAQGLGVWLDRSRQAASTA
ncbi:MAG: MBL fold metallo-hydrolase [Luteimonas sp.]